MVLVYVEVFVISYRKAEGRLVPVLHTIDFNHDDRLEVITWCKENCKAMFYPGPSWSGRFVQFEDDEDAAWFALRWS